jgi:hypothetical protein
MVTAVSVFLDSGAPSLYNKYVRKNSGSTFMGSFFKDRKSDDFSFLKEDWYTTYKKGYIDYIKAHEDELTIYANMDVINNGEATYNNQKEMESYGLHPIPVYHLGEDESFLKRYIDEGYGYLAMGGIIPNPFEVVTPMLDVLWPKYISDSNGYPKVKVHGFAVTSVRLMQRYPWFSVDSATWIKQAIYGSVFFPFNGTDFLRTPLSIVVSGRSDKRKEEGQHISTLSALERKRFLKYSESYGCPLGESEFFEAASDYELQQNESWFEKGGLVERVITPGLCNNHGLRMKLNMIFFIEFQKRTPQWPWKFESKSKIRRLGE